MKLDIGCGSNKHSGFYGIDSRELPEVDLVCDINHAIPLPDDTVEFVMASRSLPYVNDLFTTMSEIYRLCIHKAVVCILCPYAHSFEHMSNPFFKQKFDEYTPRYFTNHMSPSSLSPLTTSFRDYKIYTTLPFDFRLIRMEFFYLPPFGPPLYESEELEMLKSLQANVVQEIMYYFVVVKKVISATELDSMSRQSYPEPNWASRLRHQSQ